MIRKILFLKICFLIFFVSSLSESQVLIPQIPSEDPFVSLHLQNEYYYSVSNYKFWGDYEDLEGENYFSYLSFNPSIKYAPLNWLVLNVFGRTLWAFSQTGKDYRQSYYPSLVGGGATFYKQFKFFSLGLELKGGVPIYQVQTNTDEIVLGDGAYFVEPRFWFFYKASSQLFDLFCNIGFRYRTHSLSSLLLAKLGGVLHVHYADLGFSAEGFFSPPFLSDEYERGPEKRWNLTNQVNGGSYKFYSVNPGVFSLTGWVELKVLQPFFLTLYTNLDTLGQNYAKGLTLGLISSLRWDVESTKAGSPEEFQFEYDDLEEERAPKKKYFEEEEESGMNELQQELKRLR